MPKSAKKRREKAADFSKAKLKLGKGKVTPSNVIDTSFKARSIALPSQRIGLERDTTGPVTRRKLAFEDLLSHLKHYNAKIRGDAILGLRELLQGNPELLETKLTALIDGCVHIISDEDNAVRRSLLSFFAWLLPLIKEEDIIPHSHQLLLFTASAQTHIFPEIRIDAVRFLDVLLLRFPSTVVDGWWKRRGDHGGRILAGYLGILSAGTSFDHNDGPVKATSMASVVLTNPSKLVTLKSLSTFLGHCLTGSYDGVSTSSPHKPSNHHMFYLKLHFGTPEAYITFSELIQPQPRRPPTCQYAGTGGNHLDTVPYKLAIPTSSSANHWPLSQLLDVSNASEDTNDDGTPLGERCTTILHLIRSLRPVLLSTILDCLPAVFSPGSNGSEVEIEMLWATVNIIKSLYTPLLQLQPDAAFLLESDSRDLEGLLDHLSPYFPFHLQDNKNAATIQDLNIRYCELMSLVICARPSGDDSKRIKPQKITANSGKDQRTLSRVWGYIIQLLGGEAVPGSQIGHPISPSLYLALLPTIWALISGPDGGRSEESGDHLLQVVFEHSKRTSSTSAVKPLSISFIGHLALLNTEPQYRGPFRLSLGDSRFQDWLCHLPKCLWEAGAKKPLTTEIILKLLLRIYQRGSKAECAQSLASLRSRLAPFFTIDHAVRGQLQGPYHELTLPHRKLALDVAFLLSTQWIKCPDDALPTAVDRAVRGHEQKYWMQLIETREIKFNCRKF